MSSTNNKNFRLFEIPKIQAPNFVMSPAELHQFCDFDVKRIYFITKTTGDTGSHAHIIEEEVFLMIQGSCTAVIDRGYGIEEYEFKAPQGGMYVGNMVWHHFKDFSEDAILLAISSTNYNPTRCDYIEDYNAFQKRVSLQETQKKVLITGADGTLGQYLQKLFGADDAYALIPSTKQSLNLLSQEDINYTINRLNPDIIINCAAFNNVDGAESEEQLAKLAQKLNVDAVSYLAEAANNNNAKLIHFTSDYVFDGTKEDGYLEGDATNPVNVYGATKATGELELQKANDYLLIRTSRLFGLKGASQDSKKSIVDIMLELSKTKDHLELVDEERSSPTYAKDLAQKIKDLIELKKENGTYHLVNDGACTWYGFVQEIFKQTDKHTVLTPVTGDAFPRPAQRPLFSQLKTSKTEKMRSWQSALTDYLKELSEQE